MRLLPRENYLKKIRGFYHDDMMAKVSVGRIGKLECDFILRNPEMGYAYVQVAMTIMADQATEEREYRPFEQIRDNYPKYLLTRSDPIQQRDGIIHANIPEFMQNGKQF